MKLLALVDPLRLVTGEEPEAPSVLWVLAIAVGAMALAGLVLYLIALHRARMARNPDEYAFRVMARRLRVPGSHAALIRRLAAAHSTAPPVALLISGSALAASLESFEQHNPSRRDRRVSRQLRARFDLCDAGRS